MTIEPSKFVFTSVILAMLGLSGCTTPAKSTYSYTPPATSPSVPNEKIVDRDFDSTWSSLVSNLAREYSAIEDVDKDSGLISLAYSSDSPERDVDCGTSVRTFAYKGESRTYRYDPAQTSSYKSGGRYKRKRTSVEGPAPPGMMAVVSNVQRNTGLEGRINVFVQEQTAGETMVRVNAQYVLSVEATGTSTVYNSTGRQRRQSSMKPYSSTLKLKTGETGRENWGTAKNPSYISCVSTGNLEKRILDGI